MYGSIVSIFPHICENCCSIFSRFDRCEMQAVLVRRVFISHSWMGCLRESDCMRVVERRTLVWSRIHHPWYSAGMSVRLA